MPLSTQSQTEGDNYVLVASLDNVRNLSNILKAITFKDHAIFNATPNGLKVTVEDSKCLQANAFIQVSAGISTYTNSESLTIRWAVLSCLVNVVILFQAEIFQEFTIKEDSVGFQVNLTVLLDCLTIFGGSTVPGNEEDCLLDILSDLSCLGDLQNNLMKTLQVKTPLF